MKYKFTPTGLKNNAYVRIDNIIINNQLLILIRYNFINILFHTR